jgi:WD40 repeat protein
MLVSCGFDRAIKFWSLPEGILIKNIDFWNSNTRPRTIVEENQKDRMLAVAISPDGKILASSSYENVIKLWRLPQGELLKTLELEHYTGSLAFSPDGKLLASRGDDANTIQLWSMPEGNRLNVLKNNDEVNKLCISPDGKWLIAGHYGTITIWELPEGKQVKCIKSGGGWIEALSVTSDSKFLISGDINNRIILWSIPEGEQVKTVDIGENMIYSLVADSDGKLFASGKSNGSIQIWNLPEGEIINRIWDSNCSPNY